MKKLVIALAAVAMAVAANAATFTWKTSYSGKIYASGSTTDLISGTAFLFKDGYQAALVDAFIAGSGVLDLATQDGKLSSVAFTDGKVAGPQFTDAAIGVGQTETAFMAVIYDGKLLITDTGSATGLDGKDGSISVVANTSSQKTAFAAGTKYADGGTGWYQAAAVPEPTSGLLLLLGVAGLALKRRRA